MAKEEAKTKKKSSTPKKKGAAKSAAELKREMPVVDDLVIATELLVTAKSAVRNLAIAITETATPSVKKVLRRELDNAIDSHDKLAQYMIKNEMYHAYDTDEQIAHDIKKADTAIKSAKK